MTDSYHIGINNKSKSKPENILPILSNKNADIKNVIYSTFDLASKNGSFEAQG